MALPAGSSRPIVVGGINFRWSLGNLEEYRGELRVQLAHGQGRCLIIVLRREAGLFWLTDGEKSSLTLVTSYWIGKMVEMAMVDLWDPMEPGVPLKLELKCESLRRYADRQR